jgi:hypothetical protein
VIATLLLAVLLVISCGGGSGTTTPVGTTPTTTPATTSETPIPSDYNTYTSEGLFSISYPSDWLLNLPLMRSFEEEIKQLIANIESNLPMESGPIVFLAGIPTEEGYNPSVSIGIGSPPVATWTLDSVAGTMVDNPDLEESVFSQVKTTVDGREAVIIDFQVEPMPDTTYHYLWMVTLVGKTAWLISCQVSPEMFSDYEEDFYAIVRSFRILI